MNNVHKLAYIPQELMTELPSYTERLSALGYHYPLTNSGMRLLSNNPLNVNQADMEMLLRETHKRGTTNYVLSSTAVVEVNWDITQQLTVVPRVVPNTVPTPDTTADLVVWVDSNPTSAVPNHPVHGAPFDNKELPGKTLYLYGHAHTHLLEHERLYLFACAADLDRTEPQQVSMTLGRYDGTSLTVSLQHLIPAQVAVRWVGSASGDLDLPTAQALLEAAAQGYTYAVAALDHAVLLAQADLTAELVDMDHEVLSRLRSHAGEVYTQRYRDKLLCLDGV